MRTAARTGKGLPEWALALALLTTIGAGCSPGPTPVPDFEQASAETAAAPIPPPPPPPTVQRLEQPAEDQQPVSTASTRASADSWRRDSLADVFDALEEAAAAGDMSAAYALGVRSAQCRTVLRRDTPESLIRAHRDVPTFHFGADGGEPVFRRENHEQRLQEKLSEYEDCAVVGQKRVEAGAAWLERAGRSGPTSGPRASARLAFIDAALDEYDTRGALIADIEEASRRRKLAREWLEQLIREGDDVALQQYVRELDGSSGLYARDEAASMAHDYALQLVRTRWQGGFDRLWREGPQRYGERTPAEWDEITARGRDIYRAHFLHIPAWRER